MSKEIQKIENPLEIISIDVDVLSNMQSFQKKFLQKEPDNKEIKNNKYAGNSKYLPISFMEMTLDEIFFGLWQTKNFTSKVVANEIIGEIELWYFHPVAKTWLCRIGCGAVQIQMRSVEKGGSGDITNIADKITNTLSKDYPHLKAECFRNACLSLGKSFGRDLNREFDDQYNPVIKQAKDDSLDKKRQEIIDKLEEYTGSNKEFLRNKATKAVKENKFTHEIADEILRAMA